MAQCWECDTHVKLAPALDEKWRNGYISDSLIYCDNCEPDDDLLYVEEFTYEDQLTIFWDEVWS